MFLMARMRSLTAVREGEVCECVGSQNGSASGVRACPLSHCTAQQGCCSRANATSSCVSSGLACSRQRACRARSKRGLRDRRRALRPPAIANPARTRLAGRVAHAVDGLVSAGCASVDVSGDRARGPRERERESATAHAQRSAPRKRAAPERERRRLLVARQAARLCRQRSKALGKAPGSPAERHAGSPATRCGEALDRSFGRRAGESREGERLRGLCGALSCAASRINSQVVCEPSVRALKIGRGRPWQLGSSGKQADEKKHELSVPSRERLYPQQRKPHTHIRRGQTIATSCFSVHSAPCDARALPSRERRAAMRAL